MICRVCGRETGPALFRSGLPTSLTSMCTIEDRETVVHLCPACGHLQTPPLDGLDDYYDNRYQMSIETDDEDQLYDVEDGRPVFRSEYQARIFLAEVDVPRGGRLLDFGCAKGMTARMVAERRPDVAVHLFDVSDRYRRHWLRFVDERRVATYSTPPSWNGSFDVVMSYYVLEHVEVLTEVLGTIRSLLRDGGTFYFIVPNTFTNLSDFIVVDHVNHFTLTSARRALEGNGFVVDLIDTTTFEGALIVKARKVGTGIGEPAIDPDDLRAVAAQAGQLATRWQHIYARLPQLAEVAGQRACAIYGASFYGSLIAHALAEGADVRQVVDQNPHFRGRQRFGCPVVAPGDLSDDVTDVLVGLDPLRARRIIGDIATWTDRDLRFHFLSEDMAPVGGGVA